MALTTSRYAALTANSNGAKECADVYAHCSEVVKILNGIDYWTIFPSDGVGCRFQFQDHADRLLLERI